MRVVEQQVAQPQLRLRTIAKRVELGFRQRTVSAAEVRGVPQIVDADTVYVGTQKIRLSGVDALETDQICLDSHGKK